MRGMKARERLVAAPTLRAHFMGQRHTLRVFRRRAGASAPLRGRQRNSPSACFDRAADGNRRSIGGRIVTGRKRFCDFQVPLPKTHSAQNLRPPRRVTWEHRAGAAPLRAGRRSPCRRAVPECRADFATSTRSRAGCEPAPPAHQSRPRRRQQQFADFLGDTGTGQAGGLRPASGC